MGPPGAGPGRARRGELAPGRPRAGDRTEVRRRAGRAHDEHGAASARLPALGDPAPPSWTRRCGASVFQRDFATLVEAVLPEHARDKPLELRVASFRNVAEGALIASSPM